MLIRQSKIEGHFVGFRVHIYVTEVWTHMLTCRHTADFALAGGAELFYDSLQGDKWKEELKYVLDPQDEFEEVRIFEHTADGEVYEMKKVY